MTRRKMRLDRTFLKGPRFDVTSRALTRIRPPAPVADERIVVDGHLINVPESKIYRALERMHIDFEAQVSLGPGNALGGASVDFLLYQHHIALEYQGPFHRTTEGVTRDFWRRVERKHSGLETVYLYERDLEPHSKLYDRIREVVGSPAISSVMTKGDLL